jgi:hypothetical protein
MPSEAEIMKSGKVSIGQMQRILLKKVEELNLYTIDLNKKNEEFEQRLEKLEGAKSYSNAAILPKGGFASGLALIIGMVILVYRKVRGIRNIAQ